MNKIINFFVKTGIILICLIIMFIPTELYILARILFQPSGFWQELILTGIALYFLMGIQIIMIIIGLVILFNVLED